jgi:hypothetical protein
MRPLAYGWFGAAALAGGLPCLTQDYAPVHHGTMAGALLLALGVAALARLGYRRGGTTLAWGLPLAAISSLLMLDEVLRRHEAGRHPELPAFAALASGGARLIGEPATSDGGELLLHDAQGAIRVAASWGVVGWRPLCGFALLGMLVAATGGRGTARGWWIAVIVAVLFAMLRFLALALHYAGVDQVLATSSHPAVWSFYQPWSLLAVLVIAAACAQRAGADEAGAPATTAPPRRALIAALALAVVAGLGFGAAATWSDPGIPKRGRVLVDERLTGAWEPAGRMLDTERYGDFSAYSLSVMVEQLSRRFAVAVNAERRYDAALLADVDVLILKTPEHALDPDEIVAIRAWVEDGGGLFLISDHTDLMGMSTHLRPLAEPYGIEFAFDAVNDAAGGFNLWTGRWLPEHPISAGLGPIEFMTGCSLRCHGAARPVLALRHASSQAGDYARSSHFGGRAANPADPQGLLVAAAAAPAGRGRVLAFGDSTILSSFAWPLHARAEFVYRGVAWLDRRASSARALTWAWLLVGVAGAALALRAARTLGVHAAATLLAGLACGGAAGAWIAAAFAADALRSPPPPSAIPRVGFVIEGGHAALPPVLGERQPGPLDDADFSTFFQVPLRLGMETAVVARDPRELAGLDALVILNPDVELGQAEAPDGWIAAVRDWVAAGGRLAVLSRAEHLGHAHDRAPAYLEGIALRELAVADADLRMALGESGAGRIASVLGSEIFTSEGIGHCMQFPGRAERLRYDIAYDLFRDTLGLVAPSRRTWQPR